MQRHKRKLREDPLRARRVDTLGIVVIAILIFVITLIRFARTISWKAR